MKEITIYNTLKGRLETVSFEFTNENTTWFDDLENCYIYRIADAFDWEQSRESTGVVEANNLTQRHKDCC